MKKILLGIIALMMALVTFAGNGLWVYQSDGTRYHFEESNIDSISFVVPGTIELSSYKKNIRRGGGSFSMNITASQPWTATTDTPELVFLSQSSGIGNSTIEITALSNAYQLPYSATVTVRIRDGAYKQLLLYILEEESDYTIFMVDFHIPVNLDKNDITLTVEGMGAYEGRKLANMEWDDEKNVWEGTCSDFNVSEYKYVIQSLKTGRKIYEYGNNRVMPTDLMPSDYVSKWNETPW